MLKMLTVAAALLAAASFSAHARGGHFHGGPAFHAFHGPVFHGGGHRRFAGRNFGFVPYGFYGGPCIRWSPYWGRWVNVCDPYW